MRKTLLIALLFTAAVARGSTVAFTSPLAGSQALGPMLLEVTTDATAIDRVEFYVDGALAGVAKMPPWRVAYDFGSSLDAHTITAKVFSNGYRTTDVAQIKTAPMTAADSINVDLVEVPLRAQSSRQLTAADFRVKENKVEQTVRDVQPQRGAARFVFVIDRSLSMGDGKLTAALRAIDSESRYLRPDDTIAAVLFNHQVSRIRPMARGEKLESVFGEIVPSGGTSLRDALASMASPERTYAIVITDGSDTNSELSEEEALQRISGTKTVVDAIVLGRAGRFLRTAARNTGGDILDASRDDLQTALHELIEDINSRYLLIYQSKGTERGWRSISITPTRRDVDIVNARKGYYAK